MRVFGFTLLFAATLTHWAQADPVTETLDMKYYQISGSKLGELRRQLPGGRWGSTRWNLAHTAACDVTLTITVTLPQLIQAERLAPQDQQKYNVMYKALVQHEMDHVEILRRGAQELRQGNCENSKTVYANIKRAHISYDTRTIHGWRQGVRLF